MKERWRFSAESRYADLSARSLRRLGREEHHGGLALLLALRGAHDVRSHSARSQLVRGARVFVVHRGIQRGHFLDTHSDRRDNLPVTLSNPTFRAYQH